ncbi:hypothetical protein BpHYR1_053669, partial [Brachionus plicatilis]
MDHDDSKRRADCKFGEKKIPIIVLGDFNADSFRGNRFDGLLNDMINNLDLSLINTLNMHFCSDVKSGPEFFTKDFNFFFLKYTGCQKKVVGNFWPLLLFCTFWSLEVVGDWTLANNQSPTTSKDHE